MEDSIRTNVKNVIEETSSAFRSFSEHNHYNADFADFAGMAISQFREAMGDPLLSRRDLKSLLRNGMKKHRNRYKTKDENADWAGFVASHMTKSSNNNKLNDV